MIFTPQWWNAPAAPDDPYPELVVRHCAGRIKIQGHRIEWQGGHTGSWSMRDCPVCAETFGPK